MNARSLRSLTLLAAALLAAPLHAEILKVPQDFGTIQGAVDEAQTGDTVLVSKGVYDENVTVGVAGLKLRGKSGAVIDGNYLNHCILVNANDVEISGFTLANGGLGQTLVDGGLSAGGLSCTGTGVKISKLVVRSCESFGIRLAGTGTIEKCVVDGCSGPAIEVETGNHLSGNITTIEKCEVSRSLIGILAETGPFVIAKNKADRCQAYGILLSIEPEELDGVVPTGSLVTGNDCSNNLQYGFLIADELGTGVTVEKNKSIGNGFGMHVSGTDVALENNAIEDNAAFGLLLVGTQCQVAANKVRANGGVGIDIGLPDIVVDGSTVDTSHHVEHNVVQDNGGDGIHVASDNNTIHGNVVKDNLGDGIQLDDDGVLGNHVEENVVIGNAHDGIDNWAFATTISDNVSKNNGGADLAGLGLGLGSVTGGSSGNVVGDESGLGAFQELDMDTSVL